MVSEDIGNFTSDANTACYCLSMLEGSTKVFGLAMKMLNMPSGGPLFYSKVGTEKCCVIWLYSGLMYHWWWINPKYEFTSLCGTDKSGSPS